MPGSTAALLKWRSGSLASRRDWSPVVTHASTVRGVTSGNEALRPEAHAARRMAVSANARVNRTSRVLDRLQLRLRGILELQSREIHEVAPHTVEWCARIRLLLDEQVLLVDALDAPKQRAEVDDPFAELCV